MEIMNETSNSSALKSDKPRFKPATKDVISCDFCNKTFKFQAMLRQHEKIHYGIKLHECEVCHRRFLHKSTLKCHLRMHSGEKPYKCPHCPKAFRGQTALNCHVFRHTKEGVKCPECSKVFATSSIVKQHQRQVHTDERMHVCNLCGMRYKHLHNLRIHLRNHQKRVCPECGIGFDSVYAMQKHRKRHIVENLPFKCEFCDRAFGLRSKLTTHANLRGRSFQCDLCCHSFNKQDYLLNHQRRIHWREMGLERLRVATPQAGWHRKGVPKLKRSKPSPVLKDRSEHETIETTESAPIDSEGRVMDNVEGESIDRVPIPISMVTRQPISDGESYEECVMKEEKERTDFIIVPLNTVEKLDCTIKESRALAETEDCPQDEAATKTGIIVETICYRDNVACSFCGIQFNGPASFRHHKCEGQRTQSKNAEALICELCGNWYASATTLAVHRATHHRSKRFPCKHCHRTFGFLCYLKKHIRTDHQNERMACEMCDKTFKYAHDLKVHVRQHEDSRPFKCDQCPSAFRFPNALRSHIILHQTELPFKCDICGKHFRFQNNLRVHKRLHIGIKQYKCEICEREFATKAPMIRHMKVHEKGKELPCIACGTIFYKKVDLSIHQRREHPDHESVGKKLTIYTCEHCGKEFVKKSNLTAHSYIHDEVYRFPCKLCIQSFKQHAGLRNHMISVHKQTKVLSTIGSNDSNENVQHNPTNATVR